MDLRLNKYFFKGVFSLAIFLSITNPLYSQSDIERTSRQSERFGREEIMKEFEKIPEAQIKEAPAKRISSESEEKFLVKKINLVGAETVPPEKFSATLTKYENKELSFADLQDLAREIERDYLALGIIAAVFVPPQEVKDGAIRLEVVESKMGELDIKEQRYFNKERLRHYWTIPKGKVLRYDTLSKTVQIMDRNPDRDVNATLRAGKEPDTTDVILSAKTRLPAHFIYSFDNEGFTSTGKTRTAYGIRHNNFLGLDDMLLSGYTFGNHFSGEYAYHNIPINFNGAYLLYGYNQSKSIPKKQYSPFNYYTFAKSASVSLHQDIYKKNEYLGDVSVGFDAKDKTIKLNTGVLNRDRQRIFSLGSRLIRRGRGYSTTLTPEVSQGLDSFGASSRGNPLSSRGAKSNFTKFNLGMVHKRMNLPQNLQANLKFQSQVSSTKLAPQEEFSLGGIDSVRGYPPSDYLADNAVFSSAELLIPSIFIPKYWQLPYAKETLKESVTTIAFLDYGWGKRRGALPTERKSVNMFGAGAGLRVKLFNQALVRMEWGFPLADASITEHGASRFHFSVDFQDKLPEEIERIRQEKREKNIKEWAWKILNEELSSPRSQAGNRLRKYSNLAKEADKEGRLKEAGELNNKISELGALLYTQSEDYVRSCVAKEKEIQEYKRLALKYQKEGLTTEANNMWEKIIQESEPKPLVLKF